MQNSMLAITVIVVAMAALFFWWLYNRRTISSPATSIDETPEPDNSSVLTEEAEPTPAEGPGHLLVRFQSLNKELDQATRDLQRFNGTREVQFQGWQQLSSDIIRRILPVLDNLEPYLDDSEGSAAEVAQLAHGRLLTELVTIGVTQIIPSPGDLFDARIHLLASDSTGYPPYRVKSVLSVGYRFHPRISGAAEIVLKPAEVVGESAEDFHESRDEDVIELERVPSPMTKEI